MAPGMTTPGRSIVGAFVNTTALMWFWCYILFELYWNWNLMCAAPPPPLGPVPLIPSQTVALPRSPLSKRAPRSYAHPRTTLSYASLLAPPKHTGASRRCRTRPKT